ncbi:MAG: hypothetical protein H5T62_09525 [Anaerolineae bacterium]|nr:hypothetical protein [Anaerolineae bacterium]
MANPLYIALIRAGKVCPREEWPTGLAVYYDPGSVSLETDETLSYCFLERFSTGRLTVCSRDDTDLRYELANKAIRLLDRERRRVDANLPADWPQGIHPAMQHWAGLLFRLHYFRPDHRFSAAMLQLVREGRTLSAKQIAAVREIYREHGGAEGLRKRQHTQWRLMRLSEIDLEPKDRETVEQFIRFVHSTAGLRESKLPVIGALEEKYRKQREETTMKRAERIATLLDKKL